jgi:hypothetical protein
MSGHWAWAEMLNNFHALGGVAENVRPGTGPFGHGLFAIDRTQPILLRLPQSLVFAADDLEFLGNQIKIRDVADIGERERAFFEAYESAFSASGGRLTETEAFIAALDALPAEVRAKLVANFGMGDLLDGDHIERTRMRFLDSRKIRWGERDVVMPLIELARHAWDGLECAGEPGGRLELRGKVREEVLVRYSPHDAFGIFCRWGLVAPQPRAYSLPMKTKLGAKELRIEAKASLQSKRGGFPTPQMRQDGDTLVLSYLMIGSQKNPRLSRGIFQTLMREAGVQNPNDAFDFVLFFNRARFLDLLSTLEPHNGEMVTKLRLMARHQLEAMTHCIGTREL